MLSLLFNRGLGRGITARLYFLISLAMLPLLVLLGWVYKETYDSQVESALASEAEMANAVAETFAAYFNDIRRQNYSLGHAIQSFDSERRLEKATLILSAAAGQYPSVRNNSWVSPDGLVLASSDKQMLGRSLAGRPYFRQIQAGAPWAIGNLTPQGAATDAPTMAIGTAVRGEDGVLTGVVVAGLEPQRLGEVAFAEGRAAGAAYAIFDSQGTLVFHKVRGVSWQQRTNWIAHDSLLRAALDSGHAQTGRMTIPISEGEWLSARVPIKDIGWVAGTDRPWAQVVGPLRDALLQDALLALTVFVLGLGLAQLVARTISNPVERLDRDARLMENGAVIARTDHWAPAEIVELRGTVTEMSEALRKRAEKLRILAGVVENSSRFVGIFNAGAETFYINPAGLRMVGLDHLSTEKHLLLADYFWSEDRPQLEKDVLPVLQAKGHWAGEVRLRNFTSGQVIFSLWNAFAIRDQTGRLEAWAVICEDIGEKKRIENALRESEQRFRALADNISQLAWMADAEGSLFWYNKRWYDYTGTTLEDMKGTGWVKVHHPEHVQKVKERFYACIRNSTPWEDTFPLLGKDRQYRWFLSRALPIPDEQGVTRIWFGTNTDVTEHLEAQAAVRKARDELAAANTELEKRVAERTAKLRETISELEHFSYTITHDMRAPLRAMEAFGSILRQEYGHKLDELGQDFIRRIVESAKRMDALITDSLNYSKIVRASLELQPVNAGALLQGMLESYPEFQPEVAQIHLEGDFPQVIGNQAALTQCFSNLLTNAIKFVKPGDFPKIRVWAERRTASTQAKKDLVRFWFEDNGIGIAPDQTEKIFVMFQRVSNSYEGTGIGLALVRKAIQRMNGTAGVESEEGKGSRFWLELPAA